MDIVHIDGDGIGPEIMLATRRVLDAATDGQINWIEAKAGLEHHVTTGADPLPQETLDLLWRHQVALKGPLTTPSGKGFRSVNVRLREELALYAGMRPAKTLPGVQGVHEDVNLTVFRHNLGDLYGATERRMGAPGKWRVSLETTFHEATFRPLCRMAFEHAAAEGRRRVTLVTKRNILKVSGQVYYDAFMAEAANYPDIEADEVLIDALSMKLVMNPHAFDFLVAPNLFGDILSDLTAGLVGGLGVAPGANIGRVHAIFEAVHGTAPDIAGQNLANPTALMLSASMMLSMAGQTEAAGRLETALMTCLRQGLRTRDLGGRLTTDQFTEAILRQI